VAAQSSRKEYKFKSIFESEAKNIKEKTTVTVVLLGISTKHDENKL